ncbi:MAG TPA: alkaline phosphatase PhoX [Abditibacteriaceae bacterium]
MSISRRQFLRTSSAVALGFYGLRHCLAENSWAQSATLAVDGLVPDPAKIFDLAPGYSYKIISRGATVMTDGFRVPGAMDGMAAFAGANGKTIVVRNHELNPNQLDAGPFGLKNELLGKLNQTNLYDFGKGKTPGLGGTTTLVYDTRTKTLEKEFLSLAGTHRNCAGGPTPWGSWITCEETNARADVANGGTVEQDHGYNFEVPATSEIKLAQPIALKAMGRFNHEAVAVDPKTGIVYQTEDRLEGLIYRFIPTVPGKLTQGGKLQALVIRDKNSADTRNWEFDKRFPQGTTFDVEWMDMNEIDAPKDDLRFRGHGAGAAVFARGEGMWAGNVKGQTAIYFACTNGGSSKKGQIWRYWPSAQEGQAGEKAASGKLELYLEPNDGHLIDNADNLTVAPWGDIVLSEDGAAPNGLVRVTSAGKFHRFARNVMNDSELAGVTFSPDGSTLFFNIQNPGLTLAITGPWQKPL